MPGDNIQSVNGAGIGGVVTSVDGKVGAVDSAGGGGAVDSVDGQTGVVVLSGTYLALAGGTLTGALAGTTMTGTTLTATTSVRAGAASWAQSGVVRLPNNSAITARNAVGDGDVNLWFVNTSNLIQAGVSVTPGTDNTKTMGEAAARWSVVHAVAISAGTSPAITGAIRVPNNSAITARNAADSGDVNLWFVNTSNLVQAGVSVTPGTDNTKTMGEAAARWSVGYFVAGAFGTTPASTGAIRLPNATAIVARNAANSGDVNMWFLNASDLLQPGVGISPGTDNTKALGVSNIRWSAVYTVLAQVSATGTLGTVEKFRVINPTTTDALANTMLGSGGVTHKPLVVQGLASQSGALTEWQDSTGAVVAAVSAAGVMSVGGAALLTGTSAAATYQTLANIDTDSAMAANSDTKYASQKATKTALAAKAPTASPTFTGTVTVPDATANTAAAALRQAMFAEVAVPLVPTYYVRSPAQLGTTTGTPTLNLMTCVPIVFTNAGTLVSIAAANNANTATAVCRLGLYADNGSGQPGALIDDYGTVDFSTGPSTKTIVISRAVTAMTLYWLAAVEQTAATSAKVASNGSGSGLIPGYTTPLNSTIPTQCWTQASVSAGLPNPAVVTATGTSSIIVEVKI